MGVALFFILYSMDCIFCQISKGEIPAEIIYHDKLFVVFKDIKSKARLHFLIVPRRHIVSINDLKLKDAMLAGKMILLARKIARDQGVADSGYQLHFNVGRGAGQLVEHLHLHFMAA